MTFLDDLEDERLDDRETARRMAAFGLEADREYAALLALARDATSSDRLREDVAEELDADGVRYLSTSHPTARRSSSRAGSEEEILALARRVVAAHPHARVESGAWPAARHSAAACSRRAPRSTRVPATWRPTWISGRSSCS